MCGRATLTNEDFEGIAAELDAAYSAEEAATYRPRYNIAPSDVHWIIEQGADRRVLRPAVWGYRASGGRPLINVRGEQVGSGRGFRDAFQARRCLVVTDGFFEWDKTKAPFWFHRADKKLVLLAGLCQPPASDRASPSGPPQPPRPRFTILTTQPNHVVAPVHDRMPVVVAAAAIDHWLTAAPAEAATLIRSAPDDMLIATPVSKRVGSVKNDDPAVLAPPAAEPSKPAQRSLF